MPVCTSIPVKGFEKPVEPDECITCHVEIDALRSEKNVLEATLEERRRQYFLCDFSPKTPGKDDKTWRYFTGLSWNMLGTMCSFIAPLERSTRGNLPVENQLLTVLVRLQFELIAFQTGLSRSTVTTTVWKWIGLTSLKLDFMIR